MCDLPSLAGSAGHFLRQHVKCHKMSHLSGTAVCSAVSTYAVSVSSAGTRAALAWPGEAGETSSCSQRLYSLPTAGTAPTPLPATGSCLFNSISSETALNKLKKCPGEAVTLGDRKGESLPLSSPEQWPRSCQTLCTMQPVNPTKPSVTHKTPQWQGPAHMLSSP